MSATNNYEIFTQFDEKFKILRKNKALVDNDDKKVYNFMKDFKDTIYNTIHTDLEPYKDNDNNEKMIREYVKYVIKYILPFCNYKIEYFNKDESENKYEKLHKWIELEDDFYAIASMRSLKHFAFYMERANSKKIWRDTMPVFESYFYYVNQRILGENKLELLRASYFPGAGKTYAGNLTCCFLFGVTEKSVLRITYSDDLCTSFTKQILNIIETPQYKKVFPKFDLLSKDLYKTKKNGEIWFSFYNKASFYATTRDGQATGKRADYLMIDDITKGAKEAYSVEVHNQIINSYDSDWCSRADDSDQIVIMLGTMWSPYDLLNEVQKRAEKFSPLVIDPNFKYCKKTEDELNVFIGVPILDYDTDMSTCEKRYSTDKMRRKRASYRDKSLFNAVYQQQPEAPLELIFDHRNLLHYNDKTYPQEILDGDYECRAMIDPARKGFDYFAMGIFKRYMIDKDNEIWSKWYLVDCVFRRNIYKNLRGIIMQKIVRHRVSNLKVETNTSSELPDMIEEDLAREHNYRDIEVDGIYSTENKDEKISNARVGIVEEIVYPDQYMYDEASEMGELMVQFTTYDTSVRVNKHDDAPDMIAMFVKYNCENEIENSIEILNSSFRL